MADASEQLQLGTGDGRAPSPYPVHGLYERPCQDTGPYVRERWTAGAKRQYVVIKCNRPRHTSGDHQWAEPGHPVRFVWAVDGRPVFPLPIRSEVQHGPNDSV